MSLETDRKLLNLIQCGHLVLTADNEVKRYHVGRRRHELKKSRANQGRQTYVFHFGGSTQTVYKNRLVWMLTHRRLIPPGWFVDHRDEDKTNDHPNNLALMRVRASHRQGNEKQCDFRLGYLRKWFRFVGIFDREPVDDAELEAVAHLVPNNLGPAF